MAKITSKILIMGMLLFSSFLVSAQNWNSFYTAGGIGTDYGLRVESDKDGNVYSIGYFNATVKFDTFTLISKGKTDLYVTKMDSMGNYQWIRQIGSVTDNESIHGLAVDNDGGVYVAGSYVSKVFVYSPTTTKEGNNTGYQNGFYVHYDKNGNIVQTIFESNSFDNSPTDITVDANGKVYVSGIKATSASNQDIYVQRLNFNSYSSWKTDLGGSSFEVLNSIAVNTSGDIYVGGAFQGTIVLNTSSSWTAQGALDGMVLVFNDFGTLTRGIRIPGDDATTQNAIYMLEVKGNDVYTTGGFIGTVNLTSSTSITSTSVSAVNGFVLKLNYNPSTMNWGLYYHATLKGSSGVFASALAVDAKNNIHVTGRFNGIMYFGTNSKTSSGGSDIFVTKISGEESFEYMLLGGSSSFNDLAFGITEYKQDVYITGAYSQGAKFGTFSLDNNGDFDAFIGKITKEGLSLTYPTNAICAGEIVATDVNETGVTFSNNDFIFELSDETGSFGSATPIDTFAANSGGTFNVRVPYSTKAGTNYKIRVRSTNPPLTGEGNPFRVKESPVVSKIIGPQQATEFTKETYSVNFKAGYSYNWEVNGGNQVSGGTTNTINVQWGAKGQGEVMVSAENSFGCKSDKRFYNVTITEKVGLNQLSDLNITIYPNPVVKQLNLNTGDQLLDRLEVVNNMGQVVLREMNISGNHTIDVTSLPAGNYIIQGYHDNSMYTGSFIKN